MIVSGLDKWVTDKPVIFPINHVNAFLDPVVVAPLKWQKVHYIVRGDIFKNKFVAWVLWQMLQIPMFRQRDGASNMKKNEESFNKCYDVLKNKQRIFIFSEGDCVQEKHLRSIKKGTARMAFGAIDKHGWDIDLQLQPFTVNYSHPAEARFDMMVKMADPIPLTNYRELYEEDPARAITRVTRDIEQVMKDHYIHVEDRKDLAFFDHLAEIERNNNPLPILPWYQKDDGPFDREKNIANKINAAREEDEEKLEAVKEDAKAYYRGLKKLGIKDRDFAEKQPNLVLSALLALVGFPIFLVALVFFGLQTYFADNSARKVRLIHFRNSIRMGMGMVINTILVGILTIIMLFVYWPVGIFIPFIMLIIAWIGVHYYEMVIRMKERIHFSGIGKKKARDLKALFIQRKKLEKFFR